MIWDNFSIFRINCAIACAYGTSPRIFAYVAREKWRLKSQYLDIACESRRISGSAEPVTARLCSQANEWFASNRIPMLCAKNSGIARGQTLQVARRKCIAKSSFDVQKNDFGERSTLYRLCFIENGFGQCWYIENISSHLNHREICDLKLPITSLTCVRFIAKFTLNIKNI